MPESINPPDPPLSDGLVTLRPFRADDASAVYAACQDPEIGRWIPMIPIPYTEADARAFILMTLRAWHDGTGCEFAIVDAATDRLLGSVGVHLNQAARRHAVGYWVAAPERGRGLAVRAVRLAARWSFERLEGRRLSLWTLPGNVASQRVAEKAGFRFEGIMRNWDAGREGEPVAVVMFSMTPDELAETEPPARLGSRASAPEAALADTPRELRAPGTRAAPFVEVAAVADMTPGTMRRVTLAGLDLLVAWTADGIVVTDDRCPHMSAPLSIGQLDGCVVACPLHEGRFDLVNGETVRMPTTGGLDAEGRYHSPWSPAGAQLPAPPPTKKTEARRLTRVNRLRYYPARIRDGHLEAQLPIAPE
jgi:RimJ/RimL family protein N-acetyltransferase/nitrite reductase/ring-hydroxylating ferredoxin subunit